MSEITLFGYLDKFYLRPPVPLQSEYGERLPQCMVKNSLGSRRGKRNWWKSSCLLVWCPDVELISLSGSSVQALWFALTARRFGDWISASASCFLQALWFPPTVQRHACSRGVKWIPQRAMWLPVFLPTEQQQTRLHLFNQLSCQFVCAWLVETKTCSHTAHCGKV